MMLTSRSVRVFSRKGVKAQRKNLQPRLSLRLCAFAGKIFLILIALIATGCRRDMQDQPKIKPLRATTFFSDRLGSRQPIEGTIPRGYLRSDTEFFTGKKAGASVATATPGEQRIAGAQANAPANAQAGTQANNFPDDVDTFPLPVTQEVVERGRDRYSI